MSDSLSISSFGASSAAHELYMAAFQDLYEERTREMTLTPTSASSGAEIAYFRAMSMPKEIALEESFPERLIYLKHKDIVLYKSELTRKGVNITETSAIAKICNPRFQLLFFFPQVPLHDKQLPMIQKVLPEFQKFDKNLEVTVISTRSIEASTICTELAPDPHVELLTDTDGDLAFTLGLLRYYKGFGLSYPRAQLTFYYGRLIDKREEEELQDVIVTDPKVVLRDLPECLRKLDIPFNDE